MKALDLFCGAGGASIGLAKRMIRCEYLCVYCQKSTILEHEHDKDLHIYKDMVCLECQEKHKEQGKSLWGDARAVLESPSWRKKNRKQG